MELATSGVLHVEELQFPVQRRQGSRGQLNIADGGLGLLRHDTGTAAERGEERDYDGTEPDEDD